MKFMVLVAVVTVSIGTVNAEWSTETRGCIKEPVTCELSEQATPNLTQSFGRNIGRTLTKIGVAGCKKSCDTRNNCKSIQYSLDHGICRMNAIDRSEAGYLYTSPCLSDSSFIFYEKVPPPVSTGKPINPVTGEEKVECKNVGWQKVEMDSRCVNGESLGCNAGGQGQICRFCGFGTFPRCPSGKTSDSGVGGKQVICRNVGWRTVIRDPRCVNGESLGCNAGGQHQICRFCGFSFFPDCPNSITDEVEEKDPKR